MSFTATTTTRFPSLWVLLSVIMMIAMSCSVVSAFVPRAPVLRSSSLHSMRHDVSHDKDLTISSSTTTTSSSSSSSLPKQQQVLQKTLATAFLAGALWATPASLPAITHGDPTVFSSSLVANAKDKASASGSRVNKDAESLLRYGLPINNKEARQLQGVIEDIKLDVSSKRKAAALDGVKKSRTYLGTKADKLTASCREASVCTKLLQGMAADLEPLEDAVQASTKYLNGSEQEREALDKAYDAQDRLQQKLTDLQEQMVPANYETIVPDDYSDLPQLKGRATVEFVVKKPDKAPFDINGKLFNEAKMTMVIDGYTAPVTGGNFVDLVKKGVYDNMPIQRSDGFVVQTGDPQGEADGYVGTPSKSVGAGPHGERLIPSEIFLKGDKGPLYETTVEDEGRGGEATVLPFSSYGAMGWAREEYDVNSGSSQFFWLLFESDLTPAGKNVLDGRYPCFGYVVKGSDFLQDMKEGDVIVSAKVTDGLDLLKQPKS